MVGRDAASAMGLRVGGVVLLPLHERLHVDRWDQADRVPELLDLATPAVGSRAGLHPNDTGRLLGQERQKPAAGQLLPERHGAIRLGPMQLEDALCKIDAEDGNC